jgi:hypothetical protein
MSGFISSPIGEAPEGTLEDWVQMRPASASIFERALTFKAARTEKDGDGDGLIFDGTPQQRPAPRMHTAELPHHAGIKPSEAETYAIGGILDKIERLRPDEVPWGEQQTKKHNSLRKALSGQSLTKDEHDAAVEYLHQFYNDSRGEKGLGDPYATRKTDAVGGVLKKLGVDAEAEWLRKNPNARRRTVVAAPVRREWKPRSEMTKSLNAGDQDMSSIQETALSLFQRAMTLKEVGGNSMATKLRQRKRMTGADMKDGDGDGVIFDGTPMERPVVRRMAPPKAPAQTGAPGQQMPPGAETGNVSGRVKKKQPAPDAPPKPPREPKPKPTAQTAKPSPGQKIREANGKEPKVKTKADIVDQATGTPFVPAHSVKPKSIDEVALSDANKAAIQATASTWTQKQNSKMAAQYQVLAREVWDEVPVSRSEANDQNRTEQLDDDQKQLLKKAKEFDEKAALWAHFAENPEAAKKPFNYTPKENLPFDELVPLKESSAEFGPSGPQSWDEIEEYTQDRVKNDWIDDRLQDHDFLEWVGESIRENVDAEDVIRNNIDSLLETSDWSDLDVGQREVADQIEATVKNAMDQGVKIGKDMQAEDLEKLRGALKESSPDWKDGQLSDRQVDSMIELVTSSVNESEPGVVNIPGEDEIAEIIEIDEDDAVSQFYEAWKNGRRWARDVDSLIDSEIESMMEDDDNLRSYAESEWDQMDSDSSFEAAVRYGYTENSDYYDESETTSSQLSRKGIDNAATFVGAPDGTKVSVQGNEIKVEGEGGFYMERTISGTSISADYFTVGSYYKGQGTEIVSQMIRQARERGFTDISVSAAGKLGGSMNGYYTWPLMGYDRDISGMTKEDEIRQNFPDVETMQDLFDAPGGRDWWFVNGSSTSLEFDLSDGSRSMQVLERYLNEKRKK